MHTEGYQAVDPSEATVLSDESMPLPRAADEESLSSAAVELTSPAVVEEEDRISLQVATQEACRTILPFIIPRVLSAAQSFGNGVIIRSVIPEATCAAPVMFMVQLAIMGAARGALATNNAIVSHLNGQSRFEYIGPAINQGLVIGTVLGVPTSVLFFSAEYWLKALGTDPKVAELAGQYLKALSYGILPTYWVIVDQQFYLSIKRKYSPIALNLLLIGSSMVISYPLSLTSLKLAGLGYGVSAGAALTWVLTRGYMYFSQCQGVEDRHKYQLFCCHLDSGIDFKQLLGLTVPLALQAVSEWLPTMLISMLAASGADAQNILSAEQPAMQVLVMINQILIGFATAAMVSVAYLLGRAADFTRRNQPANALVCQGNARTQGYANLIVTTLMVFPLALLCMAYPQPLVWLFANNPQTAVLAGSMLRLTGVALLMDGMRNALTGAILGKKKSADNFFTSLANLLITGAAATVLGYFTQKDLGSLSYFVFRLAGISTTALLLLYHWEKGIKPDASASSPVLIASNRWTFFKAREQTQPKPVMEITTLALREQDQATSSLKV